MILEVIQESIKDIVQKLEDEIANKQVMIDNGRSEIHTLGNLLLEKEQHIAEMKTNLVESQRIGDSHQRIMNRLMDELGKVQQETEWYKRTYKNRSFLGMVKEKILRKPTSELDCAL